MKSSWNYSLPHLSRIDQVYRVSKISISITLYPANFNFQSAMKSSYLYSTWPELTRCIPFIYFFNRIKIKYNFISIKLHIKLYDADPKLNIKSCKHTGNNYSLQFLLFYDSLFNIYLVIWKNNTIYASTIHTLTIRQSFRNNFIQC